MTVCGDPCPACSKTCEVARHYAGSALVHEHEFEYGSWTRSDGDLVVIVVHKWRRVESWRRLIQPDQSYRQDVSGEKVEP